MSDQVAAPAGGEGTAAPVAVLTPAADTPESLTPFAAGRALAELRWKKNQPESQAAPESADTSATEQPTIELADEANAAPVEEQPSGETTEEQPDPAAAPPIEPPRSWTKEAKERWQSLPRETQEYLSVREQERDREVRRSQNEAAEQRKAIDADRQKAEQVRQQYEAQLPALMQALADVQAGQFSDIKTVDDVTRLANEDPFRYLQWQAHQTKMQAVQSELTKAQERQANEKQTEWTQHVQKENQLFADKAPEFADKAKAQQLTNAAVELLHDKGFTDQELAGLASGKDRLSIYDHRLQLLLLDGVKFRDAQKAKATVGAKPVPPVQRPGVAKPQGAARTEVIQTLTTKLERSGSLKDAAALRAAQVRRA